MLNEVKHLGRRRPFERLTLRQAQGERAEMIAALVPVKRLAQAKSRLRTVLSDGQRREFVLAMLEDVLRLTLGQSAITVTAVVSPDEEVLAYARRLGARPIREPSPGRGLNAALTFAADLLARQEASGLLILPADVPLATPADIEAVLAAWQEAAVVLSPSHSDGTSALALRPPQAIPFRFGPRSFAAHRRAAVERGLPAAVVSRPGLALDIDRTQDLPFVLAAEGSRSREVLRAAAVAAV